MTKAEQTEADLLTGKPYQFDIVYHDRQPRFRILPFLWYRSVLKRETLSIQSPTLAVLDQLSREWLEIDVKEQDFKSNDIEAMAKARQLVYKHAKRLAKIVAMAVLGENMFLVRRKAGDYIEREIDTKNLSLLSSRIYASVSPVQLAEIARAICTQSDLASFITSIALMKGADTMRSQAIEQ